jgi:hypothetical protein
MIITCPQTGQGLAPGAVIGSAGGLDGAMLLFSERSARAILSASARFAMKWSPLPAAGRLIIAYHYNA